MGYFKTARRNLETPEAGNSPTIINDLKRLAELLDNDCETGSVTKNSELPSAGTRGRVWQITGEGGGLVWDTGTKWRPVGGPTYSTIRKAEFTAQNGEVALCEGTFTAKMPLTTLGVLITLTNVVSGTTTISPAAGGAFYGPGISGASTLTLLTGQTVTLLGSGTNWVIVGGEPKQETAYGAQVKRAAGEYKPSSTRETLVVAMVEYAGSGNVTFAVGGVPIASVSTSSSVQSNTTSFIVPAGIEWSWTGFGGFAGSVFTSYLTK